MLSVSNALPTGEANGNTEKCIIIKPSISVQLKRRRNNTYRMHISMKQAKEQAQRKEEETVIPAV